MCKRHYAWICSEYASSRIIQPGVHVALRLNILFSHRHEALYLNGLSMLSWGCRARVEIRWKGPRGCSGQARAAAADKLCLRNTP